MNDAQFGDKVRQILNTGLHLDAQTATRLRAARVRALERRKLEPAAGVAVSGGLLARLGGPTGFALRIALPLLLLVLGLASLYSAQKKQHGVEAVELDVQLLSDELPIDAYLDKGFEAWLKKQRRR